MSAYTELMALINSIIDIESKYKGEDYGEILTSHINRIFSESLQNRRKEETKFNLYGDWYWYIYTIDYERIRPETKELIDKFFEEHPFCNSITIDMMNDIFEHYKQEHLFTNLKKENGKITEKDLHLFEMIGSLFNGFVCKFYPETIVNKSYSYDLAKVFNKILKELDEDNERFMNYYKSNYDYVSC